MSRHYNIYSVSLDTRDYVLTLKDSGIPASGTLRVSVKKGNFGSAAQKWTEDSWGQDKLSYKAKAPLDIMENIYAPVVDAGELVETSSATYSTFYKRGTGKLNEYRLITVSEEPIEYALQAPDKPDGQATLESPDKHNDAQKWVFGLLPV